MSDGSIMELSVFQSDSFERKNTHWMDEPRFSVFLPGPAIPLGSLMTSWFAMTGKCGEGSLKSQCAIYHKLAKN